jgi:hypothetical protein
VEKEDMAAGEEKLLATSALYQKVMWKEYVAAVGRMCHMWMCSTAVEPRVASAVQNQANSD